MTNDDRDLAARFRQARDEELAQVPGFARVLRGRPTTARSRRLVPLLMAGAAALVLAVGMWQWARPARVEVTLGDMRVPSDVLLEMTPMVRAGELPAFGVDHWMGVPLLGSP